MRSILIAALSAVSLYAQISMDGPASWYLFDPGSKQIRRAIGVPGALHLAPTDLGEVDRGWVAQDGSTVLFAKGETFTVAELSPRGGGSQSELAGVEPALTAAVSSRDASAFVLFAPASGRVQIVTRRESGWQASPAYDLSRFGGPLRVLATAPSAQTTLLASPNGLIVFRAGGDAIELGGSPVAAVMDKSGSFAYVAEANGSIRRLTAGAELLDWVPAPADGVEFAGISLSLDDRTLIAAARNTRSVRVWNASTGEAVGELPLDVAPNALHPVSSATYLLAVPDHAGEPFWLYAELPFPSAYFVPTGTNQ